MFIHITKLAHTAIELSKQTALLLHLRIDQFLQFPTVGDFDHTATLRHPTLILEISQLDGNLSLAVFDEQLYFRDTSFNVWRLTSPTGTAQRVSGFPANIDQLNGRQGEVLFATNRGSGNSNTVFSIPKEPVLSISAQNINENVGGSIGQIQVTLSEAVNYPVFLDIVTEDGTANNTDFNPVTDDGVTNRVEIPANQTQSTFGIGLVDDDDAEGNETFDVRVLRTFRARFSNRADDSISATITIVDNEQAEAVVAGELAIFDQTVNEDAGTANISVQLGGAAQSAVDFVYSTGTTGSATSPDDFIGVTDQPATIAANQTSVLIPVTIVNDTTEEFNETFTITVTPVSGVASTTPIQATITINDSDVPVATDTMAAAPTSSGGGGGHFGVIGLLLISLMGAIRRYRF